MDLPALIQCLSAPPLRQGLSLFLNIIASSFKKIHMCIGEEERERRREKRREGRERNEDRGKRRKGERVE